MGYKEIGSEFWKVECAEEDNGLFGDEYRWFMSGRSALAFCLEDIIKTHNVKSAELPSWCCESMVVPFLKAGLKISFYPVRIEDGSLSLYPNFQSDIVMIMDYFGFKCNIAKAGGEKKCIIIRDTTHSVFSRQYSDADYYFGSLRKWSGIITGGYAKKTTEWKENLASSDILNTYINFRKKAMLEKEKYISGVKKEKDYLSMFFEAEEIIDSDCSPRSALKEDVLKCRKLDNKLIKESRKRNAAYVYENLSVEFMFDRFDEDDCPMFVPILLKNRDVFRKYMTEHNIYLPIHWPRSEYIVPDEETEHIYNNCISLICDQRYNIDDMKKQVQTIKEWISIQKENG